MNKVIKIGKIKDECMKKREYILNSLSDSDEFCHNADRQEAVPVRFKGFA